MIPDEILMIERVIYHVGLHTTGTAMVHTFLGRKRPALRKRSIDFPRGVFRPNSHLEVVLATMRPERDLPAKLRNALVVDEAMQARIVADLRQQAESAGCSHQLFCSDGLSLLRFTDEFDRLRAIFPGASVQIVMAVRDPADYLRAYGEELRKTPATAAPPADRESTLYCAPDSWLADIEGRVKAFQAAFGEENVTIIDYDRVMARGGNVLVPFLKSIGVPPKFAAEFLEGARRRQAILGLEDEDDASQKAA